MVTQRGCRVFKLRRLWYWLQPKAIKLMARGDAVVMNCDELGPVGVFKGRRLILTNVGCINVNAAFGVRVGKVPG